MPSVLENITTASSALSASRNAAQRQAREIEFDLSSSGDHRGSSSRKEPTRESVVLLAALAAGGVLGFSAPGLEQWYLAWFGLTPLFLLIFQSQTVKVATKRGACFAVGFNLVYLHWILSSSLLLWKPLSADQSIAVMLFDYALFVLRCSVVTAGFAALCKWLELRVSAKLRASAKLRTSAELRTSIMLVLLGVPTLWVVAHKFGNLSDLCGVPWSMLEYTQYRQPALLQSAAWIGGAGIEFLIVLCNVSVAILVATMRRESGLSMRRATVQFICVCVLIVGVASFGFARIANTNLAPDVHVSAVQANFTFEEELNMKVYNKLERLLNMAYKAKPGMLVWSESAFPFVLRDVHHGVKQLEDFSRKAKLDLIAGAADGREGKFNAVLGFDSKEGTLLSQAYHKRFLVPFFEYVPALIKSIPLFNNMVSRSSDELGAGFKPTILTLNNGKVAPLVCFEAIDTELVGQSVANGGEVLVDVSDLAAYRSRILGEQMLSFSVLRAVEYNKYFVFAGNTGPSAVIDPVGRIVNQSPYDKQMLLEGSIKMMPERTFYSLLGRN